MLRKFKDKAYFWRERRKVRKNHKEVIEFISKVQAETSAVLFCGTALTLYRDGKVNDCDIDFIVAPEHLDKFIDFFNKYESRKEIFKINNIITEYKVWFKGISVDFFVEFTEGNRKYLEAVLRDKDGVEVSSRKYFDSYEVTRVTCSGVDILVPDEGLLKSYYGVNWNKRIKNWDPLYMPHDNPSIITGKDWSRESVTDQKKGNL